MILLLVAAPLIGACAARAAAGDALALAERRRLLRRALVLAHAGALRGHLRFDPVYWAMHLSLFGSAIWLWRELLGHPAAPGLAGARRRAR